MSKPAALLPRLTLLPRLASVLVALALAAPASAQTVCEEVGGEPGRETTARLTIDYPLPGAVINLVDCAAQITVTGSWQVTAPPPLYDFYIVIDASGSTLQDSGADVNGNGIFREPADNIYQAEIAAAEEFIRAVDPAASRVAIIKFSSAALTVVRQQLTPDMAAALATLATMKTEPPNGGTSYTSALNAIENEVLARGDRVNRFQRGIFLSDGAPSDVPLSQIDVAAGRLAALGVVVDTFALGAIDSAKLRDIATITGGTFTPLATPGDILGLLPSFVPGNRNTLDGANATAGTGDTQALDTPSGTFAITLDLVPGDNTLKLTLTTSGNTVVSARCSISVFVPEPLIAHAGDPASACTGRAVQLDGSRSQHPGCSVPTYHWLDCNGVELAPPSSSPYLDVIPCDLPCPTVTLLMGCTGATCRSVSTVDLTCNSIAPPSPVVVSTCDLVAVLDCGSGDPTMRWTWDLDILTDADGDGDPANDADDTGCGVMTTYASSGTRTAQVTGEDASGNCSSLAPLPVTVTAHPAPRNLDGGLCPGATALLSCGTPLAGETYWWDLDDTVDADLDGDPTNDADRSGCDTSVSWPTGGTHLVRGWADDGAGCVRLVAEGVLDVNANVAPGLVPDLRVSKSADSVAFRWVGVPGAIDYRVARGTIAAIFGAGAYDHEADQPASIGACSTLAAMTFTDPDDVADPTGFYYLITGVNECGNESGTGQAWDRYQYFDRPARRSTASCP